MSKSKYVKRTIVILFLLATFAYAGSLTLPPIEMTIKPSIETKTDSQITLITEETELIEGDAYPLYQKAIKALPQNYQKQKFRDWHAMPLEELPIEEIETEIANLKPTLDLINQAVKCKECKWPKLTLQQAQALTSTDDLSKYREMAFILEAQTNIQIVQGQYKDAIETIKISLTMSNHVGQAPILTQGLVAIAMTSLNLERIEHLIQIDNTPNLYHALKKLPRPFVDIEKAIKYETNNFKDPNILRRILTASAANKQQQAAHDKVRKLMNHLERKINSLQIIEALRLYMGKNNGIFPEKLSDIKDYETPEDSVTEKQFEYISTGKEATIKIEGTEGSEGRDSVRYELKLKK
ncbi:MAG: hypothetical protein JXA96_17715 [Sedimentisphaerales bacterium]|nr:hypothetical protein [Sedimentisphaerales bacterium]